MIQLTATNLDTIRRLLTEFRTVTIGPYLVRGKIVHELRLYLADQTPFHALTFHALKYYIEQAEWLLGVILEGEHLQLEMNRAGVALCCELNGFDPALLTVINQFRTSQNLKPIKL